MASEVNIRHILQMQHIPNVNFIGRLCIANKADGQDAPLYASCDHSFGMDPQVALLERVKPLRYSLNMVENLCQVTKGVTPNTCQGHRAWWSPAGAGAHEALSVAGSMC